MEGLVEKPHIEFRRTSPESTWWDVPIGKALLVREPIRTYRVRSAKGVRSPGEDKVVRLWEVPHPDRGCRFLYVLLRPAVHIAPPDEDEPNEPTPGSSQD